jgi:hypothetical protein
MIAALIWPPSPRRVPRHYHELPSSVAVPLTAALCHRVTAAIQRDTRRVIAAI